MRASRRLPPGVMVRRAPFVVVYWDDDELVIENYGTGNRVGASPVMIDILAFFDRSRDPAALSRHMPGYGAASLARAVADLLKHSLLTQSNRPPTAADRAFASWSSWHPAAGLLHFSSKDLPYRSWPEGQRALRGHAKRQPRPPAVKRYPRAVSISLPAPRDDGEFARVLLERRTWRRFSSRPVPLGALSTLLGLSSRVQYWADVP